MSNHTLKETGEEPLTILITDDDPVACLLLEAALSRQGHKIITAKNGAEAIEYFDNMRPDMIFMDIDMPVLGGYEAAKMIKARCEDRFVPILFLTACHDDDALVRCLEHGGDDFITKPYSGVILKAKVDAFLRIRSLNHKLKKQRDELDYHRKRIQREQEIAEQVFAKVANLGDFNFPNMRYLLDPMGVVNGDILLAKKVDPVQYVILGDFTYHGLPAAIGAIPVAEIFNRLSEERQSVEEIIIEMGKRLKAILPTGLFFAASLVRIDFDLQVVEIWHGGLPSALLYRPDRGIIQRIDSTNLPLGIVAIQPSMHIEKIPWQDHDRLYIYSDGVIEMLNAQGTMFGQTQLEQCILETEPPEAIFDTIVATLKNFQSGAEKSDDVTFLEIHRGTRF